MLIADDVLLVRRLMAREFSRVQGIEVVGEAGDGLQAVELARAVKPDVVVMDLEMPGLNGVEAMGQIRSAEPSIRFVLLTGHGHLSALGALAGAASCLDKGCTPEKLAEAIRQAYAAGSECDPAPADLEPGLLRAGKRAGLTDREQKVMQKVVQDDLTASQLARWLTQEYGTPVSESSVKHALERVMTKMGVEPRTRATLVKHVLELCRPDQS